MMLEDYHLIKGYKKLARFKIAASIKARDVPTDKLWDEHERIRSKFKECYEKQIMKSCETSFLDLKIKIADNIFKSCHFCERRCNINREKETGYCGVLEPRIASEFLHFGEETPLVPSHTIFFSGCTFHCVFCQNWDISQNPQGGVFIKAKNLARLIDEKRRRGSFNVNFVGGDPTPNLNYILKVISYCEENIPIIWNSNFYMSKEAMKLLDGIIDLYLTDFKFGNNKCAKTLADVENYWKIITRNHLLAKKSANMIIRHLILPGHLECCTIPILSWIADKLGENTPINIMGQYRPVYHAMEYPKIDRYPTREEIYTAREYARELGLTNLL
ncbi:MAG TPA: radical SAM protein [Methanothermobacter sp.]|nr:radical SAM protein [Methanothermobacter sp.]HOL68854.1 radical SAM protein [Methanothermobacter sp.]HPQ04747.1 radical SAM protein [Methanothermobacter sp.]HPU36665.1 radical SAM protein [Methanothermobacter sp.]